MSTKSFIQVGKELGLDLRDKKLSGLRNLIDELEMALDGEVDLDELDADNAMFVEKYLTLISNLMSQLKK